MAEKDVVVHIVGDASSYERALKKSTVETNRFQKSVDGIGKGKGLKGLSGLSALATGGGIALGLGVAAGAITNVAQAASDLNEEVSKSKQVFGASAAGIDAWSRTTASAIGISRTEALSATGTFGNLFATVGLGQRQAADMSRSLVQLAADLASFNNANPADVLEAIRSGLIGEAEPLRRFGVLLSEARVQNRALADTGKSSAKALNDQEKAVARYEIILRDTKKAQGDFAKTSGGLADQQRILRARLADTRAELGGNFLPIMVKATTIANKFLGALSPTQVDVSIFNSEDFRNKFVDAFGPEKFKEMFDAIRPGLVQAQKDFAASIQPIPLNPFNVPSALHPHPSKIPPVFPDLGFSGKIPPKPLTPEQRNKVFDTMIGREIDRSQDIKALQGQVGDLNRIAGLIQDRIAATKDVTRKATLEDDLLDVRRKQKSLRDQIKQDFISSLSLGVDKAGLSKSLVDDLAALKKLGDGLRKQIAEDKTNISLQQQLTSVEAQTKQIVEQRRQNRIDRETKRQFRQIGLGPEGDAVTPGVANLKKRIAAFADDVKGSFLDTKKTETQLAQFRKVLANSIVPHKEVRAKIDEMLRDMRQQLEKNAPKTRTTQLNANRLLDGLGLGRDNERLLRARLSHFNSSGVALAGSGAGSRPASDMTVYLDGRKINTVTTKHAKRSRARNAVARTGPNAGVIVH